MSQKDVACAEMLTIVVTSSRIESFFLIKLPRLKMLYDDGCELLFSILVYALNQDNQLNLEYNLVIFICPLIYIT